MFELGLCNNKVIFKGNYKFIKKSTNVNTIIFSQVEIFTFPKCDIVGRALRSSS